MKVWVCSLILAATAPFFLACASVKPYQKERLSDRTMIFDQDKAQAILRADILTAREGATGGYSGASAGGCSCK